MIWRRSLTLHVEMHRGYRWPLVRLRVNPRAGQWTSEGLLVRCPQCSGDGLLVTAPVKATP